MGKCLAGWWAAWQFTSLASMELELLSLAQTAQCLLGACVPAQYMAQGCADLLLHFAQVWDTRGIFGPRCCCTQFSNALFVAAMPPAGGARSGRQRDSAAGGGAAHNAGGQGGATAAFQGLLTPGQPLPALGTCKHYHHSHRCGGQGLPLRMRHCRSSLLACGDLLGL